MPATDGAPLDPGRAEARRLLTHELTKPRYDNTESLLTRLAHWVSEHLATLFRHSVGGLPPLLLVVVILLVVVVIALTVPRLRRRHGAGSQEEQPALARDETADAAALRARAVRAATAGDLRSALTDFFRALARGAEERALLPDARGRTATEIASALAQFFPAEASPLHTAAMVFDRVCYGDAGATPDDVQAMDRLERRIAAARPVHPAGPPQGELRPTGSMP